MVLVETPEDVARLELPPHDRLAVVTQTTLSVDEVQSTIAALRSRFPHMELPKKEDICYATTNRQSAVKELAARCDVVLVVGSRTSSNSNRLREVAESLGARSYLVLEPADVRQEWLDGASCVGVTSGASTPERLVEDVIGHLVSGSPGAKIEVLETVREDVEFKPPRDLIQLAMAKG
jgi:4-hydroxy-3-methylbut-2-enyl diphosphate reductase